MTTVRRLYAYTVSAVSLAVLSAGLLLLLQLLFSEILALLGARLTTDLMARQDTSLAVALILVAAPVFALHWWWISRSQQGDTAAALDERRSAIRAFHFTLVGLVSFIAGLVAAAMLLRIGLAVLLDVGGAIGDPAARPLAMLVVAGTVWLYHARLRATDLRLTRMQGAQMWLTRAYRYGAALIGLLTAVIATAALAGTVLDAIVNPPTFARGAWWQEPVATQLAAAVAGFVGWWLHWREAQSAVRDSKLIGEDERQTRLRAAYFAGVVLVATAAAARYLYDATAALTAWLIGAAELSGLQHFATAVIGPLVAGAAPFAVVGFLHARYQLGDLAHVGLSAIRSAQRVIAHVVALVGLATLAGGAWRLLDAALHALVDRPVFGRSPLLDDAASGTGLLLVGAALWLPAWLWIMRRRAADQGVETRALAPRAYLYLVLAASLIAALPAAAMTAYRLINLLLGIAARGVGETLATPVAVLIVALVVAAYHAWVLRRGTAPAAVEEVAAPPAPSTVLDLTLVLHAPAGTDVAATLAALRRNLPPETTLEEQSTGG
jgi:hypothetical protein